MILAVFFLQRNEMLTPSTIVVLTLSALLPGVVHARANGAPLAACVRIFPEGHFTASQPLDDSPFSLNVSSFGGDYTPGEAYQLTLSGSGDFRGLLVQARSIADNSPVGSFEDISALTRLSSCDRADSAITHSSRVDKTSVELLFTAPPAGTGPFRFQYAVVDTFSVFYAPIMSDIIEEAIVEEEPIELYFTGDTPMVTGNDITAQIYVSRPIPLLCQLITRGTPQMPVVTSEQNCTSGEVAFVNLLSGEHRVRVTAGDQDAVVRSRVIVMPDSPDFCSLNAINRGVTKHLGPDGAVANYTIEWRPIGVDAGFLCTVRGSGVAEKCSSPYTVVAGDGVTRVKVLPNPATCEGRRRPLVFRMD
jgi:hypothetical protein